MTDTFMERLRAKQQTEAASQLRRFDEATRAVRLPDIELEVDAVQLYADTIDPSLVIVSVGGVCQTRVDRAALVRELLAWCAAQ